MNTCTTTSIGQPGKGSAGLPPHRAALAGAMFAAAILVGMAVPLRAQSANSSYEAWRAGIDAAVHVLGYTAEMSGLPGVPSCCPEYRHGTGDGFSGGAFLQVVLLRGLAAGLRVQYAISNGTLDATEQELVTAQRDTVTATFAHTITTRQPAITSEFYLSYDLFPHVSVTAGVRADAMLGGTFTQVERIESPSTILFENRSRQRMMFDGSIPQERSVFPAITLGVRYDIPLNRRRTMMLMPEVQVWQGLGTLVEGTTLGVHGVRFGLGLGFVTLGHLDGPSPLNPGEQ